MYVSPSPHGMLQDAGQPLHTAAECGTLAAGLHCVPATCVHARFPLSYVAACSERASEAMSRVPTTSVHPGFAPAHLSGKTRVYEWGCPAWQRVASERLKRTLW